ncbi:MFS transporter [Opitutus sp. ER46]|uniref:MFS transporter n=1 Tax=Opitutus sp. ER46 TaxID=2161864 RepID=UPI000D311379|nr:MFS transporter [Opitutus sp. ER46]PTX96647.1 MFS transporter [Opitutus sp. ER46]
MPFQHRLRWAIIGLIGLATIVNYIDRTSLAVMWPAISRDTGLSKDAYASIIAVFMVCYALGQAVSGRLFDRVGTRIGFVLSITVWSAACGLHAAARSVLSLSLVRGLLGFSEAGNWPGATKAVAEWFPRHERALAQGVFNAGASVGAVVSAPIIATLYLWFGWRATFLVVAALGFLWLIPWLWIARSTPAQHPWITAREREHILDGAAPAANAGQPGMRWREALAFRQTWAVVVSRFFLDPIWWLFVNWLPIYLADRFGFDVKQIGMFAWVPYLGAAAGSLGGGWYSGHKIQQGWSVDRARKRAILIGGAMTIPGFGLAAIAGSPWAAVIAMALVLAGFQVMINNIQTLPSDFFAGKSVGTVAGIGGLSAVAGVLVFSTWLVPVLTRISYVPVFLLGAALVPLAIGSVYFFSGEIRRVDVAADVR